MDELEDLDHDIEDTGEDVEDIGSRVYHEVDPGDWHIEDWVKPDWAANWHPAPFEAPAGFKIAHLGDLHLGRRWLLTRHTNGVNLREQDIYDSARLLVEYLLHDKPDLIVIAGDLFNTMDPSSRTYGEVYGLIYALEKIAPVMIVAGNHDHKRSHRVSPLVHLRDFFGCDLHLTQGHSDYGDIRFHTLPYISIENAADDRVDIKPFETTGRDILIAHGYAYGQHIATPPEHVLISDSILTDPRFSLIMLGHVHQHSRLDDSFPAYYCGPLQPLDFGEMGLTPGYYLHVVEDSGEVTTIDRPLPSRPFKTWQWSQGDMAPEELARIVQAALYEAGADGALNGAIGKLTIVNASVDLRQSALPQAWQNMFEKELGGLYLKIDPQTQDEPALLGTAYAGVPTKLDETYYEYLKLQGHESLMGKAKDILAPLLQKRE